MATSLFQITSSGVTNITFTDYPQYKTAMWLWRIFSPLLIVIGTFGNLLSLLVLTRKRLRSSPAMFYLSILAVVDITVLYSGLMRVWLENVYNIQLREMSEGACRFHTFFVYFILSFSVWILVAVTVDRCIIVCAPFRAKSLSSLSIARKTLLAIALVLVVFNFHILFTQTLVQVDYFEEDIRCSHAVTGKYFRDYIWPWMDFAVNCIIPVAVMLICNLMIIRRIAVSARKLKHHMDLDKCVHHNTAAPSDTQKGNTVQTLSIVALGVSNTAIGGAQERTNSPEVGTSFSFRPKVDSVISRRLHSRSTNLTVMLLVVTFVFMILSLPITVYLIGFQVWVSVADPMEEAVLELGWAIANIFQYTNNSIHFLLYCLTGPRFRREFVSMFKGTFGQKRIEPSEVTGNIARASVVSDK
ncbi:hypothetical protein SNE40_000965 [Patella caerulea]